MPEYQKNKYTSYKEAFDDGVKQEREQNCNTLIQALILARKQMLKTGVSVDNADVYNTIDNAIKQANV